MINRDDNKANDIWTRLAEPCEAAEGERASVTVRKRLDAVAPGEWDLTLELLPEHAQGSANSITFKARLQILGVIRESTSSPGSRDYISAVASAFVNVAAMFGVCVTLP